MNVYDASGPSVDASARPTVSVVVINKNEPQIAGTLEQLIELKHDAPYPVELVVIDASEHEFDDLKTPEIDVWEDFDPIPGRVTIPHQRHRGVALARGEIVIFLDSGCDVFDGWLDELTRPILQGGELMVTGVWVDSVHLRQDEHIDPDAEQDYVTVAPTLTLAIARRVFELIGGFDESFAYGSDMDFCLRAAARDVRILRNPQAKVRAHWGGGSRRAKRSYVYGRARMRLLRKHGKAYTDVVGLPLRAIVYPVYMLLLPLSFRYRWLPVFGLVALARTAARDEAEFEWFKYCETAGMLVELVRPTERS